MKELQTRRLFSLFPRCSGFGALIILVTLLFPVCTSGRNLAPGLRPYLDLGWEDGRDNDEYYFDAIPRGTTSFTYRGVSVRPGFAYRPPDWPLTLDFSALKVFTTDPIPVYMQYARPGIYAAVDAAFTVLASRCRALSVGASYLNDILHWDHSVIAGYAEGTTDERLVSFSVLAGGAREFRRFSGIAFDRPLFLGACQVALRLWFIRPYLSAGFVHRLSQGPYDAGPWVHPSRTAGFISLGLRLQSGPIELSGLIHKMTAPKLWTYGGPE